MRQVYYGWYIVAISVLVYSLIIGSTFSAFGLFVTPVSEELGLSRADINTGLILLNLGNAALAPFVGRLLDRLPARRVMFACALLVGGSLAALGLSRSLWLSAVVMAVPLAAGMLGAGTITISVLLARWFVVHRGRAMALAAIGLSLGSIVVAPVAGWLIAAEGWRTALLTLGAAVGGLLLLIALAVRERPGPADVESRAARAAAQGAQGEAPAAAAPSTLQLLRMPQFWTIALGVALGLTVPQALMITLVPLAVETGLSTMEAASLISVSGITAICGKLLLAYFADRVNRVILLTSLIGLGVLPNAALLVSEGYALLLLAAGVMGITTATIAPVYYAFLADRFGLAAFGTVRGLMVPITAVIGAGGVRFIGEVYDRTGGYDAGFLTFIAVDAIAALLILATRYTRPLRPAPAVAPAAG